MKNAKSLVAATIILGGLFLTSCSSSNKTGCYYSGVENEVEPEKPNTNTTYIVQHKVVDVE